jgi:serine/threonine-protein kinase
MPDPLIGRKLEHYIVLERIGSGAMGVVYRAHDELLDRDVALKVLAGGALDPAGRGRLRKEARALSRAVHPSIATVHDFGSEGDLDFIVMELIPGPTLAQRLAEGPVGEADVIDLGCQLTLGLAAAHAAGVVHRDVKPSNLKLTPDGRLKILDFGIALQALSATDATRTATLAGRAAGTLPYMAPELVRGAEPDVRCDVYGAGAVLYEMATGRRAFPERYDAQLLEAVLRRPVVAPRTIRPELSQPLESCILKALEKDPDQRYQSADDLTRGLEAASGGLQQPAAKASGSRIVRVGSIAAAAVILALVAIVVAPALPKLLRPSASSEGAGAGAPVPSDSRARGAEPSSLPTGSGTSLTGPVRLAVLPPTNLTSRPAVNTWLPLVQSLFTVELTGVHDLGVIDPLSLNLRLASGGDSTTDRRLSEVLKGFGVVLTVDSRIVPVDAGLQLQASLVDVRSSELRFTVKSELSGESDLPRAVKRATQAIVSYFELQVLKLADSREMHPWIALREHNIEAVKAFVQANDYLYRYQFAEVEPLLRRSIKIDPAFVAPRVWLVGIAASTNAAGVRAQYAELKKLAPAASPFDQAMIGFTGAMLAEDLPGQIRYLEIALEYSPGNNILLVNLAHARAATDDCAGALRDLEPALRVRWEFPPLYTLSAACAIRMRQFAEARRILDIGVTLPAVDPYVYGLLAGLETAFGSSIEAAKFGDKYQAAQKQFGRPKEDAQMAMYYDILGRACLERAERGRAEALFGMRDRLASKRPSSKGAKNGR